MKKNFGLIYKLSYAYMIKVINFFKNLMNYYNYIGLLIFIKMSENLKGIIYS